MTDMAELIRADHVRISRMIGQLSSALAQPYPADPGWRAGPTWNLLAGLLRLHLAAAEEIAYLDLASAYPGAALVMMQASEVNADICEAIEEARLYRAGSRAWKMAVQAACRGAQAHIAYVESGPLPQYQRQTAPAIRCATGHQWLFFVAARVLDGHVP
jgi:hypothetical protein